MAKIELKGYVLAVNKPDEVGEKKTMKQTVIFKVPGYVDQFGDKVGQDEEWPLDIIGENVVKLGLTTAAQGKKAKCVVYVGGQKYMRKADNAEGWVINARLHTIELLEGNAATAPVANAVPPTTGKTW